MDLITATQKAAKNNASPTAFYALLSDYGAFDEEEPWVRFITKTICDKNFHQQLATLHLPDKSDSLKIHDIIYRLSSQYGYGADKVSTVLHKLAQGLGSAAGAFDWDREFSPTTTTGVAKAPTQTATATTCAKCGRPYYKLYSSYCAYCGSKRQ